jgi:serralysin
VNRRSLSVLLIGLILGHLAQADQYDGLTPSEKRKYLETCIAPPPTKGPGLYATDRTLCWDAGDTLTVQFLDGSSDNAAFVMATAAEWSRYANIKFVEVKTGGTIRVSFAGRGFQSRLGREASKILPGNSTMNLGFASDSGATWKRHVLHEFGHVLGFAHEHQSPAAAIPWDREKLIQYFQRLKDPWTLQRIERNVLNPQPPTKDGTWTKFDPLSIMLYPVSKELTRDHTGYGFNKELSALDKSKAAEIYPR